MNDEVGLQAGCRRRQPGERPFGRIVAGLGEAAADAATGIAQQHDALRVGGGTGTGRPAKVTLLTIPGSGASQTVCG